MPTSIPRSLSVLLHQANVHHSAFAKSGHASNSRIDFLVPSFFRYEIIMADASVMDFVRKGSKYRNIKHGKYIYLERQ